LQLFEEVAPLDTHTHTHTNTRLAYGAVIVVIFAGGQEIYDQEHHMSEH